MQPAATGALAEALFSNSARFAAAVAIAGVLLACHPAGAQFDVPVSPSALSPLDPVRDAAGAPLERAVHKPVPEQYIWTASDAAANNHIIYSFPAVGEQTEHHYFRVAFTIAAPPREATLYIAGPRWVHVWINGESAGEVSSDVHQPLGMHVFPFAVARFLKPGRNVLAIEAVRGRGVTGFTNSALLKQQTFGQVVAAKIVPAAPWVDAPALLISDRHWKSTSATEPAPGWQQPNFAESAWKPVESIGGMESTLELFQWNADAGLYNWPGYDGISPFLAHRTLAPVAVAASFVGRGAFEHLDALTHGGPLVVKLPAVQVSDEQAPSVLLDFGRELTGRLLFRNNGDTAAQVTVQYGEDADEAMLQPYLGTNLLTIPPHGMAHGPKSAYRFAKVRFVGGGPTLQFGSIATDDIFYPVTYQGSFESSDPRLNRIWETAVYTVHSCMQDDLWDAPKRDRGRWMGDTDVSARIIEDVFGDRFLLEDTLDRLLGPAPVDQQVNGIPGYSAFWLTGAAEYFRHTGSVAFLQKTHTRMLQLLRLVDGQFDARNLYANKAGVWLFVDWSPGLNGDTPETRQATTFEFYMAYRDAAFLLDATGDSANAAHYRERAQAIRDAAEKYLYDSATGTYGSRWQTNAMAVYSGIASPDQYTTIWKNVLSTVATTRYKGLVITPYYMYYVLRAIAMTGHRQEALAWLRTYWGGMLDEGATTFWEAYDLDWPKYRSHAGLEADNQTGYFASLDHGWSAGPAAYVMEEVLGIHAAGAGFASVSIRPDLAGLQWARGAEPTPHGLLRVAAEQAGRSERITVDVPPDVHAFVSVAGTQALLNGKPVRGEPEEAGSRVRVEIPTGEHSVVEGR